MNDKVVEELQRLLYNGDEELIPDENKIKKTIFEVLKEVLKSRTYRFNVGSYFFDVTPQNLLVSYDTPDTAIQITNTDIHFETTRQTEKRYFCISPEKKDVFPENTKSIEITGNIIHYDNTTLTEQYTLKLNTDDPNESIKKYLYFPKEFELYEDPLLNDPTELVLGRDIKVTDLRTDVGLFLNPACTYPVVYSPQDHQFRLSGNLKPLTNYEMFVPSLKEKKELIRLIYCTIVDFYNQYIDNN